MAINKNEDKHNRHTLVMGQSGSGKTYWLKNHPWVKKRGARLIVWDAYESHDVNYFSSRAEFARHVAAAVKSGKGFKLGLSVNPTLQNFEWFCRVVWAALDGKKDTIIIIEELADMTGAGKASDNFGTLVRVGRKFGAVLMPVTQRPQEIPKTLFSQVANKWVGFIDDSDHAYVEKGVGIEKGLLKTIEPKSYKFFYKHGADLQEGGPKKRIKY